MKDLDICLWGKWWVVDATSRSDVLSERLSAFPGALCIDEHQRLLLLGVLLEHIGTARAVSLGPLAAWRDAVAQREEDESWDAAPTVGAEQFWRPSVQRVSLRKRLELKSLVRGRGSRRR